MTNPTTAERVRRHRRRLKGGVTLVVPVGVTAAAKAILVAVGELRTNQLDDKTAIAEAIERLLAKTADIKARRDRKYGLG